MSIFSRKKKLETEPSGTTENAGEKVADSVADATASTQAELILNLPVQQALAVWATRKDAQTMYGVIRQCAAGSLLLDGSESTIADPAHPFQQGDAIALRSQVDNVGKRLLVAFTDNERLAEHLRRSGSTKRPLAIGQSAAATMQMATTSYDGIAIDPGSPETLWIAYTAEIQKGLTDNADLNEALKSAALEGRTSTELLNLAQASPVAFIGVSIRRDEQGEVANIEVPTVRSPDGAFYSPAFTSPAEVWAWGADLDVRPTEFANIARSAQNHHHAGIIVNPAGGPPRLIPVAELAERFPL